ncbi:cytochrome P450 [Nocardioides sp. AE5]|uniref:cytochrome P450 n=1 Tax=Nocardioides sp. AE5 TaxID=2962573 RepID=UPI002880F1E1|nr:cytochrome P450 [Nocardioides sp. AE5]MDT0202462.1 cytochrome P450 [Nocardioides sp. AE5]
MSNFLANAASSTVAGAKSRAHWSIVHCLPRLFLGRMAKRGDLQARMILSTSRGDGALWPMMEEMRAAGPVFKSGIAYITTDHAVVREVLTSNDFRTGIPGRTGLLGTLGERLAPHALHPVEPPSLLVTEPPDHTRYRKLVMRVFTMRAVQRLTERTQQIANDLLDTIDAASEVDLVEQYCALLPVTVIAEILGVPEEERARVLDFGTAAAPSLDLGLDLRTYRSVTDALISFDTWLGQHLDHLRRNPGDNLLSELVALKDAEGGLSEIELKSTAGLVLAAGFETTVNLLSNGIQLLHDHPEQLATLKADPDLWSNAVEEVLRLDPPVLLTGRVAQADTEVAGTRIREGALFTTMLAGANRDPRVFTDPATFDVTRENARDHLSFSLGRHHCLGASLARMEGEIGLRTLFERHPELELLPGATRRTTRILRGFERLPARLS